MRSSPRCEVPMKGSVQSPRDGRCPTDLTKPPPKCLSIDGRPRHDPPFGGTDPSHLSASAAPSHGLRSKVCFALVRAKIDGPHRFQFGCYSWMFPLVLAEAVASFRPDVDACVCVPLLCKLSLRATVDQLHARTGWHWFVTQKLMVACIPTADRPGCRNPTSRSVRGIGSFAFCRGLLGPNDFLIQRIWVFRTKPLKVKTTFRRASQISPRDPFAGPCSSAAGPHPREPGACSATPGSRQAQDIHHVPSFDRTWGLHIGEPEHWVVLSGSPFQSTQEGIHQTKANPNPWVWWVFAKITHNCPFC